MKPIRGREVIHIGKVVTTVVQVVSTLDLKGSEIRE